VAARTYSAAKYERQPDGALFYYFLVSVDGHPHTPAVMTTETYHRHVGEVLGLEDGTQVRIRTVESMDDETAGRGLDGVLIVESL